MPTQRPLCFVVVGFSGADACVVRYNGAIDLHQGGKTAKMVNSQTATASATENQNVQEHLDTGITG